MPHNTSRPEREHRAIFWALQLAGSRAANAADTHFGLRTGNAFGPEDYRKLKAVREAYMNFTDKAEATYRAEIMARYGLTDTERLEIQAEGFVQRWPFPTREQAVSMTS